MKIKRFKIKPGVDIFVHPCGRIQRIIYGPVKYVNENSVGGFWESLCHGISVTIAFPQDLSEWDDFDYILVLDEDFGQPYVPFYHFLEGKIEKPWDGLREVIEAYNEFMSSLTFLEEINGNS